MSCKSVARGAGMMLALAALSACAKDNFVDEAGGMRVTRSSCTAIGIPAYTGDITLFDPPASREARAIDVTATITNLRSTCANGAATIDVTATFDVQARRATAGPAREVVLPYFATVLRGGTLIQSKQIGRVALRFEAGQLRASTSATASSSVATAEASIPDDVLERLNRKRKPGDTDAAIDPMTEPKVRDAVSRANYELLVGFQLTQDQIAYNATR